MKKLVMAVVAVCITMTVGAQIRFGVKAGGNFSMLYVSGDNKGLNGDQYNGRFSYHFGGLMEYSFTDMFSIQPELMYLNHGANLKSENSMAMKDGHITLNTIQLPVNAKATFNLKKTKLFVYAGPYVAFNVYGKLAGTMNDGTSVDESLFSDGSDIKRLDYGVGLGVGLELNNKFTVSLGNQIGLRDINGAEGAQMKAGNITLSAGWFF